MAIPVFSPCPISGTAAEGAWHFANDADALEVMAAALPYGTHWTERNRYHHLFYDYPAFHAAHVHFFRSPIPGISLEDLWTAATSHFPWPWTRSDPTIPMPQNTPEFLDLKVRAVHAMIRGGPEGVNGDSFPSLFAVNPASPFLKRWGGRHPISPDGKWVWMKLPERVPQGREGYRFLMGLSEAWRGYERLPADWHLRHRGFGRWPDGAQTRALAAALKDAGKPVYQNPSYRWDDLDPTFAEGFQDFLGREDWAALFCPSEAVVYGPLEGPVQMRQTYPKWYFNPRIPVKELMEQTTVDLSRALEDSHWARTQGVKTPTLGKMLRWRLKPARWLEFCAQVTMEKLR